MKPEWLEIAKNLPCGGKVKVHCCGNSPSMLISHRENGYSTYCFRCDEPESHAFVPHGQRSIGEIQRHKRELQEAKGKPPHLPLDAVWTIPVTYAWFLKFGISLVEATSRGFMWSEFFNRVVVPIYSMNSTSLDAVHMRAVRPDDKPKWLNMGRPSPDAMYWTACDRNYTKSSFIVVVEDLISAIKIDLAGYNAVAILGSDITDVQVQRIIKETASVVVWFDNDAAGRKGAKDAIKQFTMQGIQTLHIESEQDPKAYSREMIQSYIQGVFHE
jgi:DNA primase